MDTTTYDYIIIGSGFGGAVSAMRLTEKGYSVLILEQGKRFRDQDFARSNLAFWKYLWAPALRCYGILQISLLKGVMVLHGAGVGGGSLGYANVLEIPTEAAFSSPAWNEPLAWGKVLKPHYATARRMLGAVTNPHLWPADESLRQIAQGLGREATFRHTEVGVFFGTPEVTVPDPYFDGRGPERAGCTECGGCMVGCRYNAKNTLPRNYLYFAEKQGAEIRAESRVLRIKPVEAENSSWLMDHGQQPSIYDDHKDYDHPSSTKRQKPILSPRYEVIYTSSTRPFAARHTIRARNVIVAAGVMGSLKLLLNCRDRYHTLPRLSAQLGNRVRTNSEALLGSVARRSTVNFSKGIAITSIFEADPVTRIEPVRYPEHSDLMRLMAAPLISNGDSILVRIVKSLGWIVRHPLDFLRSQVLPGWARKVTILLVMQNVDNHMHIRLGRGLLTLFRKGLMAEPDLDHRVSARIDAGHEITRQFAEKTKGIPMGSLGENLLNYPTTAHILGGCPMGGSAETGVVDETFQVHNYPGLYVIDGSIMPANPGVNPSLTITALAEYAMEKVPEKKVISNQ